MKTNNYIYVVVTHCRDYCGCWRTDVRGFFNTKEDATIATNTLIKNKDFGNSEFDLSGEKVTMTGKKEGIIAKVTNANKYVLASIEVCRIKLGLFNDGVADTLDALEWIEEY